MIQRVESSASLPAQYKQQKSKFDLVVSKLKDAREIVSAPIANEMIVACYCRKLGDYDVDNKEDYNRIIDVVSNWRYMVGAMKDIPAIQLRLEAEYLFKTWPNVTVEDIKICIDLMTQGILDLKLEYVNFSALFMGRVLNAYFEYKSTVITKVNELMSFQLESPPQRTPEQKVEDMKELIKICHGHFLEGFKETVFNGIVYDFLRLTGRLVITKELAEKAKGFSNASYSTLRDNTNRSIGELLKPNDQHKENKKKVVRQFGINYCLKDYFKKHTLEETLASVVKENFVTNTEK